MNYSALAIVSIVVLAALALLFRDDHDRNYEKNGKPRPAPPAPAARQQAAVRTEAAPARTKPARKHPTPLPERELTWTYLYSLEYDAGLPRETMCTQIAGPWFYCTSSDAGPVNGTIRAEPANPEDPRAQMVVRADGKKLGYLPRYALDRYETFNEGNRVCPFAGRIVLGRRGYIRGDIMIALPESRDFVKEKLTEFLEPVGNRPV